MSDQSFRSDPFATPLPDTGEALVDAAVQIGATRLAHGSTGAGNDQVRFDGALRLLAETRLGPDVEVIAPIRAMNLSREASSAFLDERGVDAIECSCYGSTISHVGVHKLDRRRQNRSAAVHV